MRSAILLGAGAPLSHVATPAAKEVERGDCEGALQLAAFQQLLGDARHRKIIVALL